MEWKEDLIRSISDAEQKIFIKFCTLLDYNVTITEDLLKKSIGDRALSSESIEILQSCFKNGDDITRTNSTNPLSKLEQKDKFLNNFLYSEALDGKNEQFNRNFAKTISKTYIEKNYFSILNKTLNDKWLINEDSFELILIHTYQSYSSIKFWNFALEEIYTKIDKKIDVHNICWKFFFLLHWLLRNGHSNCIVDAHNHRPLLVQLSKVKKCISTNCCKFFQLNPLYFALLLRKIEFHNEHTKIPGNLIVNESLLREIGSTDISVYDELCMELFDYMDKILALQSEIFSIPDLYSPTPYNKCILNPLKICLVESNQVYDIIFQLMAILHANLSGTDLQRHRNRFVSQFRQLKTFYEKTKQYDHITDSIQIPELDEPPEFH